MPLTLDHLNAAPLPEALQMLDGLYEHSPWIAERALAQRPFASLAQLTVDAQPDLAATQFTNGAAWVDRSESRRGIEGFARIPGPTSFLRVVLQVATGPVDADRIAIDALDCGFERQVFTAAM